LINSWNEVLEKLLKDNAFKKQIDDFGFFLSDKPFKEFVKKFDYTPSQNTATYLSLDFWSQQSSVLLENNMFLLRTGMGKFAIFDQTKFPSSYLTLKTDNATELLIDNTDFPELVDAFRTRQENAGLEQLNALGVYGKIINNLFGNSEWKIGPRGAKSSEFPVYAKNKFDEIVHTYDYKGQEELDYSIWTRDHILLIEAKSLEPNAGLDVGWHKLIYPASRFKKYSKYKIKPAYFLKWYNIAHFFIFPDLKFNQNGIVINDESASIPEYTFKINLEC
jgi:hypothetical protein